MTPFSVVITVFNKEKFIQNTINSVLNQTYSNFEIIIINDGSIDTTESIILSNKDSRIHYYKKENEGAAIARNFGIQKAVNTYICLLDGDDIWFPTYLEEMHKIIVTYPNEKLFSCAVDAEYKNRIIPNTYKNINEKDVQLVNYFETSLKNSILTSSSVILHKDVFEKVGYFDSSIQSGQDTDLWIRLGLHYPIVFLNKTLVRYTFDEKSLSRIKKNFNKSLHFEKFETEEAIHPKLKQFLDLNRYSLALKAKIQGENVFFKQYSGAINPKNISFKKRILLKLPSFVLKKLYDFQRYFVTIGLSKSNLK